MCAEITNRDRIDVFGGGIFKEMQYCETQIITIFNAVSTWRRFNIHFINKVSNGFPVPISEHMHVALCLHISPLLAEHPVHAILFIHLIKTKTIYHCNIIIRSFQNMKLGRLCH